MKKLAKIFAVVMVCVLAVTALVACTPVPETDYDKVKKNLEDNEYEVMAIKESEDGFAIAVAGYAIMYGIEVTDIEAVLMAGKGESQDDAESIQMMWCKSEDAAKTAYDTLKKAIEAEDDADDAIYGRSGKVVYLGTKAAINATK